MPLTSSTPAAAAEFAGRCRGCGPPTAGEEPLCLMERSGAVFWGDTHTHQQGGKGLTRRREA